LRRNATGALEQVWCAFGFSVCVCGGGGGCIVVHRVWGVIVACVFSHMFMKQICVRDVGQDLLGGLSLRESSEAIRH
jgi:hypothetical protein